MKQGKIYFNKQITSIPKDAFTGNTNLKSITIPEGVESIGESAFHGCTNLSEVKLSSTIKTIDKNAFNGCTKLERIYLQSSITTISEGAFRDCTALKQVYMPGNITTIGKNAFSNTAIEELTLPFNLTTLGHQAFYNCHNIKTLEISDHITELDAAAFICKQTKQSDDTYTYTLFPTNVVKLKFGDNLTSLPTFSDLPADYIYTTTKYLKEVVLGNDITVIPDNYFKNYESLTYVKLPNGIQGIGKCSFSYTNLSKVVYNGVTYTNYYKLMSALKTKNVQVNTTAFQNTQLDYSLDSENIDDAKTIINYTTENELAISNIPTDWDSDNNSDMIGNVYKEFN